MWTNGGTMSTVDQIAVYQVKINQCRHQITQLQAKIAELTNKVNNARSAKTEIEKKGTHFESAMEKERSNILRMRVANRVKAVTSYSEKMHEYFQGGRYNTASKNFSDMIDTLDALIIKYEEPTSVYEHYDQPLKG